MNLKTQSGTKRELKDGGEDEGVRVGRKMGLKGLEINSHRNEAWGRSDVIISFATKSGCGCGGHFKEPGQISSFSMTSSETCVLNEGVSEGTTDLLSLCESSCKRTKKCIRNFLLLLLMLMWQKKLYSKNPFFQNVK